MDKNPVAQALAGIAVGEAVVVENLFMFPLFPAQPGRTQNPEPRRTEPSRTEPRRTEPGRTLKTPVEPRRTPSYEVLDEALRAGTVEITEVSEHGSVPELLVVNRGQLPVLIVDGEELLGAKQNRVVNLTILVAAQSKLTIPVSCVEAGRWRARSASFAAAPRTQYATGRAKRMAQVTRSIVDRGERMSDQAAVWADIANISARLDARSSTSAMEEIFNLHAASLDAYVAGCVPVDGQCGAVFAIADRVVGFDLFDRADTFRRLLPKLVRSYAIEAIEAIKAIDVNDAAPVGVRPRPDRRANADRSADRDRVNHIIPGFLGAVAAAAQQRAQAVGLGEDVRVEGNGLLAAALVVEDTVVHLGGFVV